MKVKIFCQLRMVEMIRIFSDPATDWRQDD